MCFFFLRHFHFKCDIQQQSYSIFFFRQCKFMKLVDEPSYSICLSSLHVSTLCGSSSNKALFVFRRFNFTEFCYQQSLSMYVNIPNVPLPQFPCTFFSPSVHHLPSPIILFLFGVFLLFHSKPSGGFDLHSYIIILLFISLSSKVFDSYKIFCFFLPILLTSLIAVAITLHTLYESSVLSVRKHEL